MALEKFPFENFLLQNSSSRRLYHDFAANLPIIDYHCHLPPDEIAANKQFADVTEIWLKGDHYKWRAMRALGIPEQLITGSASSEEKFNAWAKTVPEILRNPLFHWTQMELKNPFGIDEYLSPSTAAAIFKKCNELLSTPEFSTRSLLTHFNVEFVGTTDDPCDTLEHHRKLKADGFSVRVAPSFRPDKILFIEKKDQFHAYLKKLEAVSGVKIDSVDSLLTAIEKRVDFFHENGCRISDHGLERMPTVGKFSAALENEFAGFLQGNKNEYSDPDAFAGHILLSLGRMYHRRGWVQQFHLGAIRNNNSRMHASIGADTGVDSVGDYPQAVNLSRFLDALDTNDQLTKTILYNNNPSDNEIFATMAGNFGDGSIRGKMQFGSAWWFLDQKDGIEKQLNTLSTMGVLSTFVGMITDSRSFLSYPRQDYFRRVLCNLLGDEMEKGLLPSDHQWIGTLVTKVCYLNARSYFEL